MAFLMSVSGHPDVRSSATTFCSSTRHLPKAANITMSAGSVDVTANSLVAFNRQSRQSRILSCRVSAATPVGASAMRQSKMGVHAPLGAIMITLDPCCLPASRPRLPRVHVLRPLVRVEESNSQLPRTVEFSSTELEWRRQHPGARVECQNPPDAPNFRIVGETSDGSLVVVEDNPESKDCPDTARESTG